MMNSRLAVVLTLLCFTNVSQAADAVSGSKPNLIFVLADDLGYGDLGCYGQSKIKTPRLDQMAQEGLRFTNFYAGNTVCAPSRSVLMTGQHMGHTHVRGNAGGDNMARQTLRDEDVTVAEVLKTAGYTNALVGKWGLGEVGSSGFVLNQGFDQFFGYLNQGHAHNYYPEFLWRGDKKVRLRNVVEPPPGKTNYGGDVVVGAATKRIDYSHDLFVDEAMGFINEQAEKQPFFLYLALTIPHANNEGTRMTGNGAEVPDFGIYKDEKWSDQDKGQAAMITRMDGDLGRIMDHLREIGIAENTLVFFTSDNGPHDEAGHELETFNPSGPLRGIKRSLTEGGIRVPGIAWWPGTVPAGETTDVTSYFGDWMATAAELAGAEVPENTDSISLVPTLTGRPDDQKQHEYLYWEFYEQGSRQAVRMGDWKAIREPMLTGDVQLYNVSTDLGEKQNVADEHPDLVEKAKKLMDDAHVSHPNWQVPPMKKASERKKK